MRMLGRLYPPFCPICKTEPGPDCADKAKDKRRAKRIEQRAWRREEKQWTSAKR